MRCKSRKPASLEDAGWTRRFTVGEPRLSEAAAMYKEAGFDVRLESLSKVAEDGEIKIEMEEPGQECRICYKGFENLHKTIYTRPQKDRDKKGEDGEKP